MFQGIEGTLYVGGHLQLVGQEPHHADTQNPPQNLPDPDGGHAGEPGRGCHGIPEDRVTDDGKGADGEQEPHQR